MNIFLICNKSPWPPREGGPIAMNAMIEGLIEAGHKVKVLAINSNKYFVDAKDIPEEYREKTKIELVYADLRIKPFDALLNLFSTKSYHVERFINKDLEVAITKILSENRFDIIQLETLFVTPYLELIRKLSEAPVFLRAHNVEFIIWERICQREKNLLKKCYLRHLSRTLKKYELETLQKVDGIIAITAVDATYYNNFLPIDRIIPIPFGIKLDNITAAKNLPLADPSNNIFHLGSMNWLPNLEGMEWFLKEVWPIVKEKNPGITLHLAGREMPDWLDHTGDPDIIIDGEVDDAIAYMRRHRIMIVPLFSGSGIRIKIIEGMMAGCVIITTAIGAEGIDYTHGRNIFICSSKQDFALTITKILRDNSLVERVGKEASEFIIQNHNNSLLINELESFYKRFIN